MSNDNPEKPLPEGAPPNYHAFQEAAAGTRFKPGVPPPSAAPGKNKAWSIRKQLQNICEMDMEPDTHIDASIDEFLADSKGMRCNGARKIAARIYEKVYKKTPDRLVQVMIDAVEGKQVQPTQELPPPGPMPEEFGTEEEAAAAHAQYARPA